MYANDFHAKNELNTANQPSPRKKPQEGALTDPINQKTQSPVPIVEGPNIGLSKPSSKSESAGSTGYAV